MKILDMQEQWVHTHIIIDRGTLGPEERTAIDGALTPVLRRNSIQYGHHIIEEPARGIAHVVVECVPLARVQKEIREALAAAIADFPSGAGRDTVTGIRVEGDEADR